MRAIDTKMPVPRRRQRTTLMQIQNLPSLALKLFDIDFVFKKTRIFLLYGVAPAVIYIGMNTEPRPASWFELINILD
ncbi:expressed unknown protein [Seminavis robusta]|uniref:Mitochondrial import receptor subunit TOM7 n=1 Tax=Seminavis robusta TaxID=568900 RepID=A0A9N8DKS7_9STRA|nr:expressed unknown protein [Seminavis robusta]|eukprot:Sro139_g065190.1 n/a (77) ;mRNA; r:90534-91079